MLEHAGEQSLSPSTLSQQKTFDVWTLADSASTDEFPSPADVDECSERLSDVVVSAEAEVANNTKWLR